MARAVAQFIITLTDAGQITVEGPIEQRMLAFGMLEVAKDVIRELAQKSAENKVQLAPPGLVEVLKTGRPGS